MQVTFLTGEYPPMQGGIADHTAYLAQHMAPLGVQSTVLINRRWEQTRAKEARPVPGTVQPLIPNWSWRCWRSIATYLANQQPHVLHIQYQAAAFDLGGWINWLPWYLRKRRGRTKIVTTFHDLRIPYIFPKAGPLRWKSVLALARYSDAAICTNREDLEELSGTLSSEESSPLLTLIPLGSNVEPQPPANFDRTEWRARVQADDQTLLLAYFGFLNESKGGEELIEALAHLRQQGINAHLLLIGGQVGHADPTNISYAKKIEAQIERLGLAAVVHRTGYVELPAVSGWLLAADAVVMPYRDGVSFRRTTLIAALRHGCPVVSTEPDHAHLISEIRPGDNMLLAPPQNAAALARTIAPLATNPKLRQELSQGAKALGQLFDWSQIASQTASLYQTVAQIRF